MVLKASSVRLGGACLVALALAAWGGCGSAKEATGTEDTDTEGASSGGGSNADSISASGMMSADTTQGNDGMDADVDSGDVDTGIGTGMDTMSFINMDTGDDTSAPQPLGGMCDGNDGCESGFCYQVPMLGGVCSECLMDSDCEAGTCALSFAMGYAECTDGSQGVMCDSDEGCMGALVCAELIDTGGFFPANFCSECDTDLPCTDPQICTPEYNVGSLGGSLTCVNPGSVADGGGCPLGPAGGEGEVCASTFCGVADLFMFVEIGVCGACVVDADCMDPLLTCVGPTASMSGLTPAACE